jgi:glyoxylase-like metal-dependent hydrolase (beta-lactamase superfamily II)
MDVVLKQFYLNCLAHASYVVGDEAAGEAVVVDPQCDVDQYPAFARDQGLRITHVVLTHLHADFLAGHLELRDRTGRSAWARRRRPSTRSGRSPTATSSTSARCA